MNERLGDRNGACGEYERLLEASHRAMRAWNEHRAAICDSGARGRAADWELLNAQAKYAKANAQLQRHIRECERCQFASTKAKASQAYDAGVRAESAEIEWQVHE